MHDWRQELKERSAHLRPLPNQLTRDARELRRTVRPTDRIGTFHDQPAVAYGEYLETIPLPADFHQPADTDSL